MGRRDASDAEIEDAARAAEIHDLVTALPQGYDTPVGERGGRLSGGQRQRVAIARALLADPPVLLVTERAGARKVIVQEGDVGDRFYIIVRGRVAVTRRNDAGVEQHVAVLEDGDHFGEIALLERVPRTATVRALTECIFLTLTSEHFLRLVEADSSLRETMERTLRERMPVQQGALQADVPDR